MTLSSIQVIKANALLLLAVLSSDAASGISRTSFRFDFPGNLLAVCESHKPTATHTADLLTTHYRYDHRGRLLADSTILNGGTAVVARYQYDELGQQTSTSTLGGTLQTSRSYNIQGWLTSQYTQRSGVVFNSQLRYYDPQYGTDRSYSGNISEWTWKNGSTAAQNTYAFTYDQLSRLEDTKQYVNGSLSNQFVEKGIDYDRNGNILSLQRTANGTTTENLSYAYSGNRLVSLSGTTSGTYDYDARGNMTRDGVQNLDLAYNHLDLIEKVECNNAVLANYSYLSDGTKLAATDSSGDGLVYAGSLVYSKQNGILSLESAAFSNGRFVATTSGGTTFAPDYYVTDHLGSVRTIIDSSGTVKERNDYYPYGMRWTVGTSSPDNRYRYNAKEEQSFVNVPYIDYGARMYDAKYRLGWNGIDMLAETTTNISPFAFTLNNPIRYIDPNGMWVGNPDGGAVSSFLRGFQNAFPSREEVQTAINDRIDNPSLLLQDANKFGQGIVGLASDALGISNLVTGENKTSQALTNAAATIADIPNMSAEERGNLAGKTTIAVGIYVLAKKVTPGVGNVNTAKIASSNAPQYTVVFETKLASNLKGKGYNSHFKAANTALNNAMTSDAAFGNSMAELGIVIPRSPTGSILGKSPSGWVWHHAVNPGVIQLVPKAQHTIGSSFWNTMHPGGVGGMSIWGK